VETPAAAVSGAAAGVSSFHGATSSKGIVNARSFAAHIICLFMRKKQAVLHRYFVTENKNLSLLGDVARLLGCKPHRIVYLLSSGQVAEPAMRLGNRRVFTKDDIARIAAKLTLTKKEKQMSASEFLTMREIGKVFGVTSHVIGGKLKELGLRTVDGKPTYKAFQGGYCEQRWTEDREHYCWAWHAEKI
jgi:hypothetical protein